MSMDFLPVHPCPIIKFADVFDGRLEEFGIREHINDMTCEVLRCLTDGQNYVWLYVTEKGVLGGATRYGGNNEGFVLGTIARVFAMDWEIVVEPEEPH